MTTAREALRRVLSGRGTLDDVSLVEVTLDQAEALVSVLRLVRPLVSDGRHDAASVIIDAALRDEGGVP